MLESYFGDLHTPHDSPGHLLDSSNAVHRELVGTSVHPTFLLRYKSRKTTFVIEFSYAINEIYAT